MKRILKCLFSFFLHPIKSLLIFIYGGRRVVIGSRLIFPYRSIKYVRFGKNVVIGRDARFLLVKNYNGKELAPSVEIGRGSYIGNYFSVLSGCPIKIGNDCLIASFVLISSESHSLDVESSNSYGSTDLECGEVTIGNGCWIGEKATILKGVSLGDRCVVGANSVVTHSFPAGSVIAGAPAKLIKKYDFNTKKWE